MVNKSALDKPEYFQIAQYVVRCEYNKEPATIDGIAELLKTSTQNTVNKLSLINSKFRFFDKKDLLQDGKVTKGRKQVLSINWMAWAEAFYQTQIVSRLGDEVMEEKEYTPLLPTLALLLEKYFLIEATKKLSDSEIKKLEQLFDKASAKDLKVAELAIKSHEKRSSETSINRFLGAFYKALIEDSVTRGLQKLKRSATVEQYWHEFYSIQEHALVASTVDGEDKRLIHSALQSFYSDDIKGKTLRSVPRKSL